MELAGTIVGTSGSIREMGLLIDAAAPGDAPVLFVGERGSGREHAARALHARSPRRDRPFVAIRCGGIGEAELEGELFGFVKGAFPGALRDRGGRLDAADGGTLLIGEIAEAPLSTQARLLRLLQEGRMRRVGSAELVPVDVRVLASSDRDLASLVKAGRFREELYYRLQVSVVEVPPLRERVEDVALLASHFLRRIAARTGRRPQLLGAEALELLRAWRWPGNVRELEEVVERAAQRAQGDTILPSDLPAELAAASPAPHASCGETAGLWLEMSYAEAKEQALRQFEKGYVESLLRACGGNISAAARRAGMDRSNFKRVLRKYRADVEADGPEDHGPRALA